MGAKDSAARPVCHQRIIIVRTYLTLAQLQGFKLPLFHLSV